MSCLETLPSFSNLDGAPSSSPPCTPSPTPGISSNVEKEEEEEDLPELLLDYGVIALPEFYSTPPAKVRHMYHGIGTFQSINQSGQYCYDFGSGRVFKVFNKPHGPTALIFYVVNVASFFFISFVYRILFELPCDSIKIHHKPPKLQNFCPQGP